MDLSLRSAFAGTFRDRRIVIGSEEGIVVVVDINYLVTSKVHRIGIKGPGAAEEFGMEHLQCQRLPSARGASGEDPGVGLADDAEMLFQVGNKLGHDRVAIRAII